MSTKAEDTQKNILNTARKHFLLKRWFNGASLKQQKMQGLLLVHLQVLSDEKRHFLMH